VRRARWGRLRLELPVHPSREAPQRAERGRASPPPANRRVQGLGFTCEWACFAASSRSQDFGFGVFGVTYLALVAQRLVWQIQNLPGTCAFETFYL